MIAEKVLDVMNSTNTAFPESDDLITLKHIAEGQTVQYKYGKSKDKYEEEEAKKSLPTDGSTACELDRLIKIVLNTVKLN